MDARACASSLEEVRRNKARKRKKKQRQVALLISLVAAVVVMVERFVTELTPLLLPCQTTALTASVRAATLAVSKLQLMLSVADCLSEPLPLTAHPPAPTSHIHHLWFGKFLSSADDLQWRHTFRMRKAVFLHLLHLLQPELPATAADAKLAATLYRLATGASPRSVARKFALTSPENFASIFDEVCRALQSRLSNLFDFPSAPELLHPIIHQFTQQGLPNCCGVVGCTRFPVMPTGSNQGYFQCTAGYPAVAMQGVVDAAGRFLDISVGWGGSMEAAQILLQTRLFSRVMDFHELLHGQPMQLITGAPMPEYIIADPSYPLLPWLLTPFTNPLLPPQQLFNRVHHRARSIASRAFGTLKASWRLLTSGELTAGDGCIIAAACILHNFLIYSGELLLDEEEPLSFELCCLPPCDNSYGESIRDALAAHLSAVAHSHTHLP